MGQNVEIELATRAVTRLEACPADIQRAMIRHMKTMARALQRQLRAINAIPSPTILPRVVPLQKGHERIYRIPFVIAGAEHYITFRWPKYAPIADSATRDPILLILSVGNWDDKFCAWCGARQRGH